MALLFVSCEKELFHYAEITEYHAESQQLDVATTDSIARFSSKVQGFVAQHPDAKDDPCILRYSTISIMQSSTSPSSSTKNGMARRI
jgi:hypothetical protein